MERIFFGSLKITTVKQKDCARMDFEGGCDIMRPEEVLTPMFDDLIIDGCSEIVISFDNLKFFSSSMIPPIVKFIEKLEDFKQNCVITFDSDSKWQLSSFKPLKNFVIAKGIRNTVVRSR